MTAARFSMEDLQSPTTPSMQARTAATALKQHEAACASQLPA
jgi:hypothetical protein